MAATNMNPTTQPTTQRIFMICGMVLLPVTVRWSATHCDIRHYAPAGFSTPQGPGGSHPPHWNFTTNYGFTKGYAVFAHRLDAPGRARVARCSGRGGLGSGGEHSVTLGKSVVCSEIP